MGFVMFILMITGIITVAYMIITVATELGAKNIFKIAAYSVAAIVVVKIASFLISLAPDVYATFSEWAAIAISLAFLGFSLYACAVVLGDLFHEARRFVSRLWQSATAKTRP